MSSKSKVTVSVAEVKDALNSAVAAGHISQRRAAQLEQMDDMAFAGSMGVGIDQLDAEDATLVSVVIDASGSMDSYREDVIKAYNTLFLDPLRKAKNNKSILVSTWVFSSGMGDDCRLLHSFIPIPDCPNLDRNTYSPDGGTPLNDAVNNAINGLVSYGQILENSGTRTKRIVVVISDGEENSSRTSAKSVKTAVTQLLSKEIYVMSYCFFGDPNEGDRYADNIGFPKQHRLTDTLDPTGIRRLFGQVSSSIISASSSTVSSQSLSANTFFVQTP